MTCEGFLLQPGGCSPVKLLGFTCFYLYRAAMFLGKKGESMPASANSAYSAQCIFGMLLDSVCGYVEWAFCRKDGTQSHFLQKHYIRRAKILILPLHGKKRRI